MPQIIFNKNGINICLYHMHGFCVAENMRRDFGRYSCISFPCHICIFPDNVRNSGTGQFVPASIPKQRHIWIAPHINMVFSKVTAQQFGSLFHKGHSTDLPAFSMQSDHCWKIQSHISHTNIHKFTNTGCSVIQNS